jgi:hypothetical protein
MMILAQCRQEHRIQASDRQPVRILCSGVWSIGNASVVSARSPVRFRVRTEEQGWEENRNLATWGTAKRNNRCQTASGHCHSPGSLKDDSYQLTNQRGLGKGGLGFIQGVLVFADEDKGDS